MDKVILSQKTLLKVEKSIARLKSIGLNVESFIEIKDQIVKESSNLGKKSDDYTVCSNKLEKLYNELLKYEITAMASSLIKTVKNFINADNKTIEGFNACREQILNTIKNLNNSNTLDNSVESHIENIYHVVYLFIKEEIKYFGISETLNNIDLVNNEFMNREVLKDIESIDLRDSKYAAIKTEKDKIDAKGFNKSYISQTLISAIVNSNANILEKAEILKDLDSKLISVQKTLDDLDKQALEYKKVSKLDYSNLLKNIGMTLLNASILVSCFIGTIVGTKLAIKDKKYLNKTTLYNPKEDNPYTITEEYDDNSKNILNLVEYSPWEEHSDGVLRNITTYDLSGLEQLSYDEYLSMNLEELNIKGDIKTENKESIPLEDLYSDTLRLIKEIEVNKDNFIGTEDVLFKAICLIFLALLVLIILYRGYSKSHRYRDDLPLIYDLKGVYNEINALKYEKNNKKEYEKKVLNLEKKMLEIIKNNEGLLSKVESIIPVLENEPEYKKMAEDTKKRLSLIREYSKKIPSLN